MSRCGVWVLRCVQLLVLLLIVGAGTAHAQQAFFTYQGRLQDGGSPANGAYDFQFTLWDSLNGGTQQPQPTPVTVTKTVVVVSNGVFTVVLGFGATAFTGDRFLEIGVRLNGGGSYTVLSPRQWISSTPYAIRANSAGTADTLSNGQLALSTAGTGNLFAGTGAGQLNTGTSNAFFGISSGQTNSTGQSNAFFGSEAGKKNSTGSSNAFFGESAGASNQTGFGNAIFGAGAGSSSDACCNSMFGHWAGLGTTGVSNSFFGYTAGQGNTTGTANTALGAGADFDAPNLTNATAIGYRALVSQNNSLVLGSLGTKVGIGTSAPVATLDVRGNSVVIGNVGIGTTAPGAKLEVNAFAGAPTQTAPVEAIRISGPNTPADANSAQDLKWAFSSAGSAGVRGYRGNSWDTYLQFLTNASGQGSDLPQVRMHIDHTGNVGIGTTAPAAKLHVNGIIRMDALGAAGLFQLCWNASDQIGTCASSLRYKKDVQSFRGGLAIINRLRPISFTWKEAGVHDVGLAAEEVAQVEPLLTFRNDKGEIEGVKYNQLSAVFINAFKEQQAQIEKQRDEIAGAQARVNDQQRDIERLIAANGGLNARLRAVEQRALRRRRAGKTTKKE